MKNDTVARDGLGVEGALVEEIWWKEVMEGSRLFQKSPDLFAVEWDGLGTVVQALFRVGGDEIQYITSNASQHSVLEMIVSVKAKKDL